MFTSSWYVRVRPWYSGTMLPVKLNVFLLTEGRLILRKKIKSSLLIRELDSCRRVEGSREGQNTCILINKVKKYVKCHLK